jgi:hypothetical protein
MIIIKNVPGLTNRELLDALLDLDPEVQTGHGGFVVSETVAAAFLTAYLHAASDDTPVPVSPEPATSTRNRGGRPRKDK